MRHLGSDVQIKVPRSSMASSSSSISSSVTISGLWTESKESWDSMAAKSFLCCCCCSLKPLLLVSNLRLKGPKEQMVSQRIYPSLNEFYFFFQTRTL